MANWVTQKVLAACCRGPALLGLPARPRLPARTPRERCLSVLLPSSLFSPQLPYSSRGGLARCLPSGSPLAPGILKLAAVSPGVHLSLTWQGIWPAGVCSLLPHKLSLSRLHGSTSPWDFPRPLWAQQKLCWHFRDVWVWVCTEDQMLSQFPACTAPSLTGIFLDHSGHSSSFTLIFRMLRSGSAQRTQGLVITWILHTGWVFFAPEHPLLSQSYGFFLN